MLNKRKNLCLENIIDLGGLSCLIVHNLEDVMAVEEVEIAAPPVPVMAFIMLFMILLLMLFFAI